MGKMKIHIPEARIADFCKKWGVKELALFGSALGDYFDDNSDVDLLVAFQEESGHTLFDLVRMQGELRDLFGRQVDIVSRRGIEGSRNHLRREAILGSAERLYAEG
jgi:predicted nucleotidyltransferase